MSSSFSSSDWSGVDRGPMFWLPPGGFGNGLTATAWAQIADLSDDNLPEVLFSLTESGIPAHVAALRRRPGSKADGLRRTTYRLWVASSSYGRAQDVLMPLYRAFEHPIDHGPGTRTDAERRRKPRGWFRRA
jgi:hypothetical protein